MGKPVTYVVKGGPVLNDATHDDALLAGMEAARLIDNGSDHVGTDVEAGSEQFQEAYYAAQLILAKGQANYASLVAREDGREAATFFLLQTKCATISAHVGVPVGSAVVMHKAQMRS